MKIIAVDPGYERVGIAVLEKIKGKEERLIYSNCFKTPKKLSHSERLSLVGEEIRKVIKKFKPEALAVESLFFNENRRTAIKVSEARGVIIYEAALKELPVFEYTPLQIKIAVIGYGRATKNQVISMVKKLIHIDKKAQDDEYDAIATGITHFAHFKKV